MKCQTETIRLVVERDRIKRKHLDPVNEALERQNAETARLSDEAVATGAVDPRLCYLVDGKVVTFSPKKGGGFVVSIRVPQNLDQPPGG